MRRWANRPVGSPSGRWRTRSPGGPHDTACPDTCPVRLPARFELAGQPGNACAGMSWARESPSPSWAYFSERRCLRSTLARAFPTSARTPALAPTATSCPTSSPPGRSPAIRPWPAALIVTCLRPRWQSGQRKLGTAITIPPLLPSKIFMSRFGFTPGTGVCCKRIACAATARWWRAYRTGCPLTAKSDAVPFATGRWATRLQARRGLR